MPVYDKVGSSVYPRESWYVEDGGSAYPVRQAYVKVGSSVYKYYDSGLFLTVLGETVHNPQRTRWSTRGYDTSGNGNMAYDKTLSEGTAINNYAYYITTSNDRIYVFLNVGGGSNITLRCDAYDMDFNPTPDDDIPDIRALNRGHNRGQRISTNSTHLFIMAPSGTGSATLGYNSFGVYTFDGTVVDTSPRILSGSTSRLGHIYATEDRVYVGISTANVFGPSETMRIQTYRIQRTPTFDIIRQSGEDITGLPHGGYVVNGDRLYIVERVTISGETTSRIRSFTLAGVEQVDELITLSPGLPVFQGNRGGSRLAFLG